MNRISDAAIGDVTYDDVSNYANIRLPVANVELSTPGTRGDIGVDEIARACEHKLVTFSSHGLTAPDEKKPLAFDGAAVTVWDDTDPTTHPLLWLDEVVDANTLRIVFQGLVTFADTLMEVGYTLSSDGPYVFWDLSLSKYTADRPVDSATTAREVFAVLSVSGGVVTALKLPWGPLV